MERCVLTRIQHKKADIYYNPFMLEAMQIPILYDDEFILAVNKPAGLLTIRDGYNPELPYALQILQRTAGKLWVVHRLDKDTSGILIFARSAQAHRFINQQFENRQTEKEYQAIVYGTPTWDQITADFPLRVNGDRQHRTVVDPENGKPARTNLSVGERFSIATLVAASPRTGYTHQIRAHLAALGYPILFDPLYAGQALKTSISIFDLKTSRLALHAYSLSILHPGSGQKLTFSAPLPPDLKSILQFFRV